MTDMPSEKVGKLDGKKMSVTNHTDHHLNPYITDDKSYTVGISLFVTHYNVRYK